MANGGGGHHGGEGGRTRVGRGRAWQGGAHIRREVPELGRGEGTLLGRLRRGAGGGGGAVPTGVIREETHLA